MCFVDSQLQQDRAPNKFMHQLSRTILPISGTGRQLLLHRLHPARKQGNDQEPPPSVNAMKCQDCRTDDRVLTPVEFDQLCRLNFDQGRKS